MRKIKIFNRSDEAKLESEMNIWLAEHRTAIVHQVLQSESFNGGLNAWSLTITIFYYEGE